jgi:sugar lactone lactonase YvrE
VALDGQGNLYVANYGSLVRYAAADIAGSGDLPVSPELSVTHAELTTLNGLALDRSGNVYLLRWDGGATSRVLKYSAASLTATGTQSIAPTLILNNAGIAGPQGIALDVSGNLWIANFGGSSPNYSVVRYNASLVDDETGTQTAAPSAVFTSTAFVSPNDMAFDEGGNLWVANFSNRTVVKLAGSQLQGAGIAITPQVTVTGTGGGATSSSFAGIAFDPRPAALGY